MFFWPVHKDYAKCDYNKPFLGIGRLVALAYVLDEALLAAARIELDGEEAIGRHVLLHALELRNERVRVARAQRAQALHKVLHLSFLYTTNLT